MVGLDGQIADYVDQLDRALAGIPADQKEDILQEIRTHITDSVSGSVDGQEALERVFHLLGTPGQLADRYRTEAFLTRAGKSFSPLVLFQTSWRWAKMGAKGMLAFFIAICGYGSALAWTVTAMMKPFVPSVGLWVGGDTFQFGPGSGIGGKHELLGNYYIPVVIVLAFAAASGTTHFLRWLMRQRVPRLSS
jgi:hypothetical protein